MHDPARYRPTERFSNRVSDYALARPGYPAALTDWLMCETGLREGAAVADLGSGTGLYTRDLLAAGLQVHAVEPNADMRVEAERALAGLAGFISCDGRAEATGLTAQSVDLVTAAQAFHWFELEAARAEVRRILRPNGHAALIWNVRRLDSAFAQAYEAMLLRHCPAYAAGQPRQAAPSDVAGFFVAEPPRQACFEQSQQFDFAQLRARLLSSSYTPKEGDVAHPPLLAALRALFDAHQRDGVVAFEYLTQAYLGRP